MFKYKSVIAFRNDEKLNISSVPVDELPVTMNFDQRNIVGKAKLRLGENGEILADIDLFDNPQILELMKPCVSICSTSYISSDVENL